MSNETTKCNDQPASERSCPAPAGSGLVPFKLRCRVKIRPDYNGRKPKPGAFAVDGEEHIFEVMWRQGDDDPYPGEYAMAPADDDVRRRYYGNDVGWISSGDLEILSQNDREETPTHE